MPTTHSNATRRTASCIRANRRAGFSLIELTMTLAIGIILAALAVPAVRSAIQYFRVRSAASSIAGAIQSTRYRAIFDGCPYNITLNKTANTLQVGSETASGNTCAQVYTIKQGGTTTTITIDNTLNTTTVVAGGTTLNIVDGDITSLSGPGQGVAAIQDNTALTITAAKDVTVTGDILYKTSPVTTTQNQIPGAPADTLIPGNDHGQVLGIFTAKSDVQMDNKQSNGNLEIDASIAMISQGGTGGWINIGNHIDTLVLMGGRIANQAKSGNTTTRNIFFDRRYAQNGFAPSWYPSTTVQSSASNSATMTTTIQRTTWFNRTTY